VGFAVLLAFVAGVVWIVLLIRKTSSPSCGRSSVFRL
jgi:hypothetical protein